MDKYEKIEYEIDMLVDWHGVHMKQKVTGYRVSPNFATRQIGRHYLLNHLGSGAFVGGYQFGTIAQAKADAEKLERATYPNGQKFHWETLTSKNMELRAKRAGKGFLSRILGRPSDLKPVG